MEYHEQTVYLSLGSNEGDRLKNLEKAVEELKKFSTIPVHCSSIYETPPWGYKSNSAYLNMCVSLDTSETPHSILKKTQKIEYEMGRRRDKSGKYFDRIIDIDILFFGNQCVNTKKLIIPHPLINQRIFVLKPLLEIAPNLTHPLSNKALSELIAETNDKSKIILHKK